MKQLELLWRTWSGRKSLLTFYVIGLGAVLFVYMLLSLFWRMEHDIPLLNYAAYLMNEHGFVIYKDIFETSMPGTFLFHAVYTSIFGYSDLGYRLCDLLILSLAMWGTYKIVAPLDKETAMLAAICWGIFYLSLGETIGLQKDYVGLVTVILATAIIIQPQKSTIAWLLTGILLAFSCWIKPHLLIWTVPTFTYMYLWRKHELSLKMLLWIATGFAGFSLFIVFWLYLSGGLAHWWDIFANYVPLHIQLDGAHKVMPGFAVKMLSRAQNLVDVFIYYPSNLLFLGAFIFLFVKRKYFPDKGLLIYLLLNVLAFYIYPAISGQFWIYHWVPFFYFAVVTIALIFFYLKNYGFEVVPTALLILFSANLCMEAYFNHKPNSQPKGGVVDELAAWLSVYTDADETIQPLDWTGGSHHAMLIAGRRIATSYLYDYHFYHHTSTETIQNIRKDFIRQVKMNQPDYFIEMHLKPMVSGEGTSYDFEELENILKNDYKRVVVKEGYTIYKKNKG